MLVRSGRRQPPPESLVRSLPNVVVPYGWQWDSGVREFPAKLQLSSGASDIADVSSVIGLLGDGPKASYYPIAIQELSGSGVWARVSDLSSPLKQRVSWEKDLIIQTIDKVNSRRAA